MSGRGASPYWRARMNERAVGAADEDRVPAPTDEDSFFFRVVVATFAVSLLALFVALPSVSQFSPDAWTVHELAGTIGRDFFRANTAREYATGSSYSSAFAPAWPLVVALFRLITGNIYSGYIASFLSYAAFAAAAELFGRRALGVRAAGVLSALLMLRFLGLREELSSGRSIPLYLCELALLGTLLVGLDAAPRYRSALAGLLAGVMLMTRFDSLPAVAALLIGAPFVGVSRDRVALLAACIVVAIAPWIVYSLVHFNTVFVTDNRAVVLSLDPRAFVQDFHSGPQPTLLDAPVAWVAKVLRHIPSIGKALVLSALESVFLPLLGVLSVAVARRAPSSSSTPWAFAALRATTVPSRTVVLFVAITIAPITGYVLTGYWDHRYFTASIWLAELLLLAWLARWEGRAEKVAMLALVVAGGVLSVAVLRYTLRSSPLAAVKLELDRGPSESLVACLRQDGASPDDGVVFTGRDVLGRFKFGALTGWRVLPIPSNWPRLERSEQDEFLRRYRAAYVMDSRSSPGPPIGRRDIPLECALPLRKLDMRSP